MGNTIHHRDVLEIEWADASNTRDVDTKLARIGAALMMRIYPAGLAKIMLRRARIELIKRQVALTDHELDIRELYGNGDGTSHPTVRT